MIAVGHDMCCTMVWLSMLLGCRSCVVLANHGQESCGTVLTNFEVMLILCHLGVGATC